MRCVPAGGGILCCSGPIDYVQLDPIHREPPVFADEVGEKAYRLHQDAQTAEAAGDHMAAMRLYRHCRRSCPEYADFVGLG